MGCLSAGAAGSFKLELREGMWVGDRAFGGIWTLSREISGEQRERNTAFGAGQSGRRKTEESELTEGPQKGQLCSLPARAHGSCSLEALGGHEAGHRAAPPWEDEQMRKGGTMSRAFAMTGIGKRAVARREYKVKELGFYFCL